MLKLCKKCNLQKEIEDTTNLIILCKSCHLYKAHKGNFKLYDEVLAEELLTKAKLRN